MSSVKLLLVLVLGSAACHPALAQDAPPLAGAPDCRFVAIHPLPMQSPAWDGACKGGFADGEGALVWGDGTGKTWKLEATLAGGQVVGEARMRFPQGGVYIGTFKDGMPDGHGYFREANGDRYEGDVRMGERSGTGKAVYGVGDSYQGEWKHDKRDGTGVQTFMLGGRYEGAWKDDRASGAGKLVYAGSPAREAAVVDGRLPGQPAPPAIERRHDLKRDNSGSIHMFRDYIARRIPVPPTLGYRELSAADQANVRQWFPALASGDEPPYPLHGPAPFYKAVARVIGAMRQEGRVFVYVLVGKNGKAESVTAIGLDDPEARKVVAAAAGLLEYKPALCGGQPCEMMYPYWLSLQLDR